MGDEVLQVLPPENPVSALQEVPPASVKVGPEALMGMGVKPVAGTISIAEIRGQSAEPCVNCSAIWPLVTVTGNDLSMAVSQPACAKISKFVRTCAPFR